MNRSVRINALLAGCLLGGVVLVARDAAGQDRPAPEAAFKKLDANGDGKLSREEFQKLGEISPRLKGNPNLVLQIFFRLDTSRDGSLSLEEYRGIYDLAGQSKPPAKPAPKTDPAIEKPPTPDQLAFFEKKVRPVLVGHCYQCHSTEAEKIRGGLVLDTRPGLRKGGDSGPVVIPGDPKNSLLIKAIRHQEDNLRMPPKEKLSAEVVADFEKWVAMGAPDPRQGNVKTARTEIDIEKGRQFWSFQPPKKQAVPMVKDTAWPRGDIDRFLLARLEEEGLRPVADADPAVLLRRLYVDLIGLPPIPEDVEAFVKEYGAKPQAALEAAVDRLLASPQFGERWGRHWLDVARYAESSGRSVNLTYPHAWRYRDYVIASFHADKPYDRFVQEQLAGDLLPAADDKRRVEQQIATGFLALGPKPHNERVPLQFQMDVVDEQIDAMSQAFLGLTVACARCHDHKFDPIPQQDYYALAGIFRSTETCYGTVRIIQSNHPSPLLPLPADAVPTFFGERLTAAGRAQMQRQLAELHKERDELVKDDPKKLFTTLPGVRLRSRIILQETRVASYDDDGAPKQLAMGARERGRPTDSPLFTRGEIDKPGEVVPRGVVQVVSRERPTLGKGSGRLALAEWITAPDNPLTARVMVNRVWLHLFGRGIVATPDNFGAAGQPPSHPALLDYLAVTFVEDGWSVKKLIRRLVLSRAYQLSSQHQAPNHEADPDNALVWRMSKRRLDAEALRDAMLAVGGALDLTPPRGSAVARAGDGNAAFSFRTGVPDANFPHRSVYLAILRDQLPETLALFDAADPSMVVSERATTSVPAQGLYLLNSPFVMRLSAAAADRLLSGDGSDRDRLRRAYLRFFARPPSAKEIEAAEQFLAQYTQLLAKDRAAAASPRAAWAALCQALFASAEFLYLN